MYKKYSSKWVKHLDFIVFDIIAMHISYCIAYCIRKSTIELPYFEDIYWEIAIVLTLMNLLVSVVFNSYTSVLKRNHWIEFLETMKHVLLVSGLLMLYMFLVQKNEGYSRFVIFVMMGIYLFSSYFFRMAYKMFRRKRIRVNRSFLLIVNKNEAEEVMAEINKAANNGIRVKSLAIYDEDMKDQEIKDVAVVANKDDVVEYICREWIDEVFVSLPHNDPEVKQLIGHLIEMGVTVHVNLAEAADGLGQNYFVEKLGGYNVITSSINYVTPLQMLLKRLMDIIGGLIGSIFTVIIGIFIAPFILIKSPGPLLFKQERIGLNGKRIKIYKFRSMYMDAEERKKELMAQNRVSDGMMFKLEWDPRVIGNRELPDGRKKTGIGEFIRKTSLDEFPQFFNVLKGDMSIVGTRPPTKDEWEKYKLHHRARLAVRPGITGMWQVSGRSEITDFEQVVKLDTEYIINWSIWMDIKIIFKTFVAVLKGKGAM